MPFSPPDSCLYRVSEMEAVSGQENVSSLEKISFLLYKILKSHKLTVHIQEKKKTRRFSYIQGTGSAPVCERRQSNQ